MAGLDGIERDGPRGECKGEQATEIGVQYDVDQGGESNVQRRGVRNPAPVGGKTRLKRQM
jgi:hypothetical protein